MTAYEQGFKTTARGQSQQESGMAFTKAAQRAVMIPADELRQYLAARKAIDDEPTPIPLISAFRKRRRLNALYRAFAERNGFDPNKQLYMHPGAEDPAASKETAKEAGAVTAYEQGFIDKCAELGVDPSALVKRAKMLGGPDPAPGMYGASAVSAQDAKRAFMDKLPAFGLFGMPTFAVGRGKMPRLVTNGDIRKMTTGLPLHKKFMARVNPMVLDRIRGAKATVVA